MKEYTSPKIDIIEVVQEDIITTSSEPLSMEFDQ